MKFDVAVCCVLWKKIPFGLSHVYSVFHTFSLFEFNCSDGEVAQHRVRVACLYDDNEAKVV